MNKKLTDEIKLDVANCIACNSKDLYRVIDLGLQPLANVYKNTKTENQKKYPLVLNFCKNCSHCQLNDFVHQDILFKNYVYISGTAKGQIKYFDWFSDLVISTIGKKQGSILDIGCNDGSQLNSFKKKSFATYGIDPAKNLHKISSKNHNVVCGYFNEDFDKLKHKFDAIVCQNAFAHNYNQLDFLQKCKKLMTNQTKLFITASQVDMIKNNEFDTIYHEHYSYYTVSSMKAICERAGLRLIDVIKHDVHGNTYIYIVSLIGNESENVKSLVQQEINEKMFDVSTYKKYKKNAEELANKIDATINDFKNKGFFIVGCGSPAKSNTMINFKDLKIDLVVDDNKLKQEKYVPGTSIPVKSFDVLNKIDKKICYIVLAWNFFDEIKNKIELLGLKKEDLVIRFFPALKILKNE